MIRTDVVALALLAATASLNLAPAEAARLPIVESAQAPLTRQVLSAENRPLIQRDEPRERSQANKRLDGFWADIGNALGPSASAAHDSIVAAASSTDTASLVKDKDSSEDKGSSKGSKGSPGSKGSEDSNSDNPDAISSAITQAGTSSPTVPNQKGVEMVTAGDSSSAAKATSTGASKKSKDSSSGGGDDQQVAAAASTTSGAANATSAGHDAGNDDEECDEHGEDAASPSAAAPSATAAATKAATAKASAGPDSASGTWTWVAGALGCPHGQKPHGTAHLCTATSFAAGKPNTSTAPAAAASGAASSSSTASAGASASSSSTGTTAKSKKKKACKPCKSKTKATSSDAASSADATSSAANKSAAAQSSAANAPAANASSPSATATAAAQAAGSDSAAASSSSSSGSGSTLSASRSTASLSPAATSASVQGSSGNSNCPTLDVPRISIPKVTKDGGNDDSRVMMPMRRGESRHEHLVKSLKATIKSMKKVGKGLRKLRGGDAGKASESQGVPVPVHDAHTITPSSTPASSLRSPITTANEHALLPTLTVLVFLGTFFLPLGVVLSVRHTPSSSRYFAALASCVFLSFTALCALRNTLVALGALEGVERAMAFELIGADAVHVQDDASAGAGTGHLEHKVIIGRDRVEFAWTYFFVGLMQVSMGMAIRQCRSALLRPGAGETVTPPPHRFAWGEVGRFVLPVVRGYGHAHPDEKGPLEEEEE